MRRSLRITVIGTIALAISAVLAADLPETKVKAVGLNSKTVVSFMDEQPFWNETVPAASNGRVTADYAPIDQLGIKDFQIMRLGKLRVMDFGAGDISKMAGDDPVFEGCDLAGLALDIDTARKACAAWAPMMAKVMEEKFNIKLLALGTNPPQVFWCRVPIAGLADLQGKKIRVFNKTMADFLEAVSATAISMPFAEVVPALQRGVVDCAVTGTLSGNTAGWPEVSTHLYPMYLGWSINYQSANLDSWKAFGPEVQAFFAEQFEKFEDKMWDTAAKAVADAENCNFGKDPCTMGKMANMTPVAVSDDDKAKHTELMQDVVLVNWARRCGADCAKAWNETVGQVVGLQIPLDKL